MRTGERHDRCAQSLPLPKKLMKSSSLLVGASDWPSHQQVWAGFHSSSLKSCHVFVCSLEAIFIVKNTFDSGVSFKDLDLGPLHTMVVQVERSWH
jgi:hypothetical protein